VWIRPCGALCYGSGLFSSYSLQSTWRLKTDLGSEDLPKGLGFFEGAEIETGGGTLVL